MSIISALGFTTTLEARMALWAGVALALAGVVVYIHHAGYEECRAPQIAAQKAQKAADVIIDQGVTNEAKNDKAALTAPGGIAATPPPELRVRFSGCVPAGPTAPAAGPIEAAAGGDDRGVLPGGPTEATVDVGPVVQTLALAGVLRATNGDRLWERDVKESQPLPKAHK